MPKADNDEAWYRSIPLKARQTGGAYVRWIERNRIAQAKREVARQEKRAAEEQERLAWWC